MVLIWGLQEDSPTARVAALLSRLRVPAAWVNQQDVGAHRLELEASGTVRGTLYLPGGAVNLSDIRAAYLRPYDFRRLRAARRLPHNDPILQRCAAFEEGLHAWAEITEATVINRFSAMASNGSKPYQSTVIRQFGFSVPETLITTDPTAARAFWEKHRGGVVYKSISGHRSIVSRLNGDDRERLSTVARCPTQFQQFVPGTDYRVHVVADRIFACRIRSRLTDYRYDSRTEITTADLPDSVAERCYRLTKGLGLEFGGVDLRHAPTGEWFCFEVNPSPGFTYYEEATGLPIGAAIAAVLAGVDDG